MVNHPDVIRPQFFDRSAHTINAIVIRGDHKWAERTISYRRVLGLRCHRQSLAGILEITRCSPTCCLRVQTLVDRSIQFEPKRASSSGHNLPQPGSANSRVGLRVIG